MSSPITSNTSTIGKKHELPTEETFSKKQKPYWKKEHFKTLEEVLKNFSLFRINLENFDQIPTSEWEIITKSFNEKIDCLKTARSVRYYAKKILFSDNFTKATPPLASSLTTTTTTTKTEKSSQQWQTQITKKCFIRFHQGYEKGKQENIHSTQPPCFSDAFNSFFEQNLFYKLNIADQSFYLGYMNAIQRLRDAFFSLQDQTSPQESLIERLNTLYPKENESLEALDLNIYQKVQKDLKKEAQSPSSQQTMHELFRNGVFPFELHKTNDVGYLFHKKYQSTTLSFNQKLQHFSYPQNN